MMDDLISRQAAIKALEDAGMTNYLATGDFYGIINALTVIKNLPTAEKRGKWISDNKQRLGQVVKIDDDGCPMDSCHCSVCGDWLTASDEYAVRGRYCPNCGARMEEEHGLD